MDSEAFFAHSLKTQFIFSLHFEMSLQKTQGPSNDFP